MACEHRWPPHRLNSHALDGPCPYCEIERLKTRHVELLNEASGLRLIKATLEAQLKAHVENEGDECPLCRVEAQLAEANRAIGKLQDAHDHTYERLAEARKQIDFLEKRYLDALRIPKEARADTARLDWLETAEAFVIGGERMRKQAGLPTVREAIDAVQAAERGESLAKPRSETE